MRVFSVQPVVAIISIIGAFVSACGSEQQPSAEMRDIRLKSAHTQGVVYREGDFVVYRICVPQAPVIGRDCQAQEEPKLLGFPEFVRSLNASFGVTETAYREVGGLAKVREDIDLNESIATSPGRTPDEVARANEEIGRLRGIELNLVQTDRIAARLEAGSDSLYDAAVSQDYDKIVRVFGANANAAWFDRYNRAYWQYLGGAYNWYDAMSIPRQIDVVGRPSDPYHQGCAALLGSGWRLPTIFEVEKSVSAGLRFAPIARQLSQIWTRETAGPAADGPMAYIYAITVPASQARPKYFTAPVLCIKN